MVTLRHGRYGPYVQLGEDRCGCAVEAAPSPHVPVQVDDARGIDPGAGARTPQIPRVVGEHPGGGEITAHNGRYGPYVKWGKETRSLDAEEDLLTVTLDEAVAKLAQPKQGRRTVASLRQLGQTPDGKAVDVRDGRFGPYVTDGETNASLRVADTVEGITLERAIELLEERRAKGPAKPRKRPAPKGAKKAR